MGCLTNQPFGDVDIFLIGDSVEAKTKLRWIFEAIKTTAKSFDPDPRFLVIRSPHAVSIFTCKGCGRIGAPIQIILNVYASALDLLSDFDLDCCSVAYVDGKVPASVFILVELCKISISRC